MGMNPAMKIAGIWNPAVETITPMLVANVNAGATEATPRTAPENVPTLPLARPLDVGSAWDG